MVRGWVRMIDVVSVEPNEGVNKVCSRCRPAAKVVGMVDCMIERLKMWLKRRRCG